MPEGSQPERRVLKGRMVLSIMWGILVIPSLVFFIASLFAFDAPGASQKPLVWIAFIASFTLPLVLLISCIGGIASSRGVRTKRKNLAATFFVIIPLLTLLGAGLLFIA